MEYMLASWCTAEHIKKFLKETRISGMCMGERREELTNVRKLWWHTVHGCTCTGHLSLFLSLAFSLFFFILLFYCNNIVASLLSFILFSILFFLYYSYFLHHRSRLTLIPRVSLILLFHTFTVPNNRVHMHSHYQLIYII